MRQIASSVVGVTLSLAACISGSGNASSTAASSAGPASSPASTATSSSPSPSISLTQPELPKVETVAEAGGVGIEATHDADWTLVAFGRTWVAGLGKGIGFYDSRSGRLLGSVPVPQGPCAAMDAGFGAVWTATCGAGGVSRIDPHTGRVTGHLALPVPSDGESSIGAGEGGVWAIADGPQCSRCVVARIDPRAMRVTERFPIPDGATAVRAGLGGVWITYFDQDTLVHLDPSTGEVVATIPLASGPRFFDVGLGAVWVMAQRAGALCQIDPGTDGLVECQVIDPFGVEGGDLTVGGGFVWFRGSAELVAQVDRTGHIVRRLGPGRGSGSASAGSGQLWISAHDVATMYRVPLR